MERFILNVIHRPEMVPEYAEKVTGHGKEENISRGALLTESLDIFKTQQAITHKNGIKTTIQMTYASLFNDEAVALAKEHHARYGDEIALSLLGLPCKEFREKYRTRDFCIWMFSMEDKKAIVTDVFEKFFERFGFYPQSTGSYYLDADLTAQCVRQLQNSFSVLEQWHALVGFFVRVVSAIPSHAIPEQEQEIMLSLRSLETLGIDRPEQGMQIDLKVIIGLFRTETETFRLSGWFTDHSEDTEDVSPGYISRAKLEDWGFNVDTEADILFRQSDGMDWRETEERMYADVPMKDSAQKITVSDTNAYEAVNEMMGGYGMAAFGLAPL